MNNKNGYYFLLAGLLLIGCSKNNTYFYEDAEKENLSIFSNKGYNIFTCYVNDKPWRTDDRISTSIGRINYELEIEKQRTGGLKDTLIFTWKGSLNDAFNYKALKLRIAIDSGFTYINFKTNFNAKRIVIDSSTNGYFTTNLNSTFINNAMPNIKGNGVILFQNANIFIPSIPSSASNMAGLLSAKIGNNIITDGRFDHSLDGININF